MFDFIMSIVYLTFWSWIVLGAGILAYPTVLRLKERKDEFGWVVKVPVYVLFTAAIIADVIFNAIVGSIRFWELPKEWLFTARLKRHWYSDNPKQVARATKWVWRVNQIHEGHI